MTTPKGFDCVVAGHWVRVMGRDFKGRDFDEWRKVVRTTKTRIIDCKGKKWNRSGYPLPITDWPQCGLVGHSDTNPEEPTP